MQVQEHIVFHTPLNNYKRSSSSNNTNTTTTTYYYARLLPGIKEETERGGWVKVGTVPVSQRKKEEIRHYKLLNFIWSFNSYLLLLDTGDTAQQGSRKTIWWDVALNWVWLRLYRKQSDCKKGKEKKKSGLVKGLKVRRP